MLGTNDPNNQKLQKSLKNLAAMAKWNYDVVSYDPANPATFNAAIDTAITKKANYIAEAGIPLTPAMIKKVQDAGAKWVLTSVHPAEVKDPIIVDANAYANDALMGKVLADFFVSDSKGKGNVVIEHVPAYPILGGFTDGFQAEVKALDALDGLDADADVAFILTTNRVEDLEVALSQRPGRVDLAAEIPLPDAEGRRELLRLYGGHLFGAEAISAAASRAEGTTRPSPRSSCGARSWPRRSATSRRRTSTSASRSRSCCRTLRGHPEPAGRGLA